MSPQSSIAHYRIVSKLGEGGMGEVWRATDTKLKRDVAIKVLPQAFAQDPDRMARFVREAQVLASLNHPNVAAIYGVEERALVMELVEGHSLPLGLPIETALDYAGQIADGVEYAHGHGVVHRDLKPANIKVTPEGRVKILDFGLAKAVASERKPGTPDSSTTITLGETASGMILGTPAYMAPEQARGLGVDRRADIWAFGVILYEMLTGTRLFRGPTDTDTLASVLRTEPDLSAVSPRLRPVLHRCLQKDARQRWQAIGDVRIAIEESASFRSVESIVEPRRSLLPWLVTFALAVALVAVSFLLWRRSAPVSRPEMRFTDDLRMELSGNGMALSPDGMQLVFAAADKRLHLRSLDTAKAVTLAGTEGAVRPFFSPDGNWIGFFAERKVKKIAVQGGAPVTLCDASNALGASWGTDGYIVYTPDNRSGLMRVPAAGGQPQVVSKLDARNNESTHRFPQVLPGARAVLFTSGTPGDYEDASIEAQVLQTGERKLIYRGGYHGRYLDSGHLVYLHEGELFAAPMDLNRLQLTGPPAPILDDVSGFAGSANADFDFSRSGTLAYVPAHNSQPILLEWMDASGRLEPMNAPARPYFSPMTISPDGTRLAVIVKDGAVRNLWAYDWKHDRLFPITAGANVVDASAWSADGTHLIFQVSKGKSDDIFWLRADDAGQPTPLLAKLPVTTFPGLSLSPDGKLLAFLAADRIQVAKLDFNSGSDHPRASDPQPFDTGLGHASQASFSPDGRWLAYVSDESGQAEVYVAAFPGPGGKWLVSKGGGGSPAWSRNGSRGSHELFYQSAGGRIMSIEYTAWSDAHSDAKSDSFDAGPPRVWSDRALRGRNFAIAPDGTRLAVAISADESSEKPETHVVFLLNFFTEIRRKAPAK